MKALDSRSLNVLKVLNARIQEKLQSQEWEKLVFLKKLEQAEVFLVSQWLVQLALLDLLSCEETKPTGTQIEVISYLKNLT